MPQDPNLYGQRPTKKQKREAPLASSLTFASQMSSLLSAPAASSGRSRPSKSKDDLFNVKVKRKADTDFTNDKDDHRKIRIKDKRGTEEEKQEFMRTKRKMEEKARLYAAMKRGDYIPAENEAAPLVDFDRKWAEKHDAKSGDDDSSSGSDNESDGGHIAGPSELIEYQDEYGRTRKASRAEISKMQRQSARSAMAAADLEAMAGRPIKAPQNVIYGDAIQSAAFNPDDNTYDKMESLAAKRDRTPTPPPDAHFDGHAEIRNKGVGFYHFSQDSNARQQAQDNLVAERENTERIRKEREAAKEERRKLIEKRRAQIAKKRAEKQAENFLDGLGGDGDP